MNQSDKRKQIAVTHRTVHENDSSVRQISTIAVEALVLLVALMTSAVGSAKGDEIEILRKAIPERLIVLTFDDGCRSHATVAAPVLKRLGFNATFYVVQPGVFSPRRSWYVSYRELQTLARDGFEIGNHTSRHQSGAKIEAFLELEDYLLAHKLPKPSTVCWPMYGVNTETYSRAFRERLRFWSRWT